ncbi:MAG TPA: hypothetical protein VM260_23350, partial [Pirellula sp.]|nr:hypothetical protein [Pirellula sp.]
MNEEQENFESLKKLLTLKRYEQPPPGYFNELPHRVWKRIETENARPTFWARVFPAIGLKPAVAYAFGLVVCGTLIIGIGSALRTPDEQQLAGPLLQTDALKATPLTSVGLAQQSVLIASNDFSNTNPAISEPSLYPGPVQLNVQPVGFRQTP